MDDLQLQQAISTLSPRSTAARLRPWLPLIEAKLATGVSIADIVVVLNANGIGLSAATFRSYLQRYRQRQVSPNEKVIAAAEGTGRVALNGSSAVLEPATKQDAAPLPSRTVLEAVRIDDLSRVMQPDPLQQAEQLQVYDRLARQTRKAKSP